MTESLEERYYGFTETELEFFAKQVDIKTLEYYHFINQQAVFIRGLFFEIESCHGNWSHKDRVLKGLFRELSDILENIVAKIQYYDKILKDEIFYFYYNDRNHIKVKNYFASLTYLVSLFNKEYFTLPYDENLGQKGRLSDKFTHLLLDKSIRKMRIRILNIIKTYKKYTKTLLEYQARKGISSLIHERIHKNYLPMVINRDKLIDEFFYYLRFESPEIKNRILEIFSPSWGNDEYHLGLYPIWSENGKTCYCFRLHPRNSDDPSSFLLITDAEHDIWSFRKKEENYYQNTSRSLLQIFQEIDKENLYLDWFFSEPVKYMLIFRITSGLFYTYLDECSKSSIKDSREQLEKRCELFKSYYGVMYEFDELITHAKEKKVACIEKYNYTDREKQRQKRIIEKLFLPEEELAKLDQFEIIAIITKILEFIWGNIHGKRD